MSKKHFQKLAYELMSARPDHRNVIDTADTIETAWSEWRACVDAVSNACAQSNSAFDRARFRAACEAESYSPAMHGR